MSVTIQHGNASAGGAAPSAAAQSDQETATSTTTYVAPGTQQFHPSAAKCWGIVTTAAGTPTLAANFNITSITDTAAGRTTITIGTDFSSANYSIGGMVQELSSNVPLLITFTSQAAGSFILQTHGLDGGYADSARVSFGCYGDQ